MRFLWMYDAHSSRRCPVFAPRTRWNPCTEHLQEGRLVRHVERSLYASRAAEKSSWVLARHSQFFAGHVRRTSQHHACFRWLFFVRLAADVPASAGHHTGLQIQQPGCVAVRSYVHTRPWKGSLTGLPLSSCVRSCSFSHGSRLLLNCSVTVTGT